MNNLDKNNSFTKLYGIQLEKITILELFIRSNQIPNEDEKPEATEINLLSGYSEYDVESKRINIAIKIEIGLEKDSNSPFSMRVELVGEFCVDEEKFPIKHIEHWAKNNAPYILHPYLREQVYALTSRIGFDPLILPLVETPVLTIK